MADYPERGEHMFFLIAAFICSAMVSLVLKVSERWEHDKYGMFAVNYSACLIPFLISRIGSDLPVLNADFSIALIFAAVNGFLYLAGMVMNQLNVKRNGAALQAVFARLGVMVPTCLSIVFFGERPTPMQGLSIIMVLAAFCVMNIPAEKAEGRIRPAFGLLFLSLITNGLTDSFLKIFEVFGNRNLDDWFMGATFLSAAAICIVITIKKHGRIGRNEIAIGLCLGIPNYLSSLLLLKSLPYVSAYIAYPTYSVGAILIVMVAGILIFREKLSKWSMLSIVMIIPAVILLNSGA